MAESTYPQQGFNTVNRYKHQATYDTKTIHTIINSTPILHVSFIPDPTAPIPTPVILPMIGQIGLSPTDAAADETHPSCYLHGYVSSRLMNLAAAAVARGEPGLPLCVAGTILDGLVLSLTPNTHNYNYRSAVLHGTGSIVTDADEKLWAMRLITDSVVPGRYEHTRVPPDNAEMQSTRILKVKIDGASGKVREGGPEDERKDLKREEVLESVWTGVVPVWEKMGEPRPGPYNRVVGVPGYLAEWVEGENGRREGFAEEVAGRKAPVKRGKRVDG